MIWRARMASSRVVTFPFGSGSPLELAKTDFSSPISRARCVSLTPNSASLPARPSASTMHASFADWIISPCRRSSTETLLWIAANMVEPCDGAPPFRHAFSLTIYSSVSLMRPSLSSWNTYSAVMSFARLAGKTSRSASRSNRTAPYSASIRIACGAPMFGSSFFGASFRGASFFCAAGVPFCGGAAIAAAQRPPTMARAIAQRANGRFLGAIVEPVWRQPLPAPARSRPGKFTGGNIRLSKGLCHS